MSLSFVFGGSGSGKSNYIYERMISMSMQHPDKQFLIIVPDQFTMQTQKELIAMHPRHGIMNMDVLSFGRLSHRIFEETGEIHKTILDDTGKNLLIRTVAGKTAHQLTVLKNGLQKQGYIHEIKSAISEFKQYAISEKELDEMIKEASNSVGKQALAAKLEDLSVLYREFDAFIKEQYLTSEETLQVLAEKISASKLIKDSYIVFDGFTGFTPIQMNVIGELLQYAKEVWFTILLDGKENPYVLRGEQELFALSKRTVSMLRRKAEEKGVFMGEDVILKDVPVYRLKKNATLSHLEQNLFRYPSVKYSGKIQGLSLVKNSNPAAEVIYVARNIRRLLREGYQYRDIAVVCGNVESYQMHIPSIFAKFEIPFFMDQNRGILLNPFMEFVRSALLLFIKDFSRDAVMAYLRTGLIDIENDDIDFMDNYLCQMGIRGKKRWLKMFVSNKQNCLEDDVLRLNQIREKILETLRVLFNVGDTASEKVKSVYEFITQNSIQEKLEKYKNYFEEQGDLARAKEYHQIYPYIIDLLTQIHDLLGEEKLSLTEFAELLDAGFSEIQVGIIPQNVDHIVVGDMERTRLKEIKVLFFLGVNDGNIPKSGNGGGIISDVDREFLKEKFELAPSPREKIYTQRLYIYMNLTKPSDKLFLSYACIDNDGKPLRPAYLIEMIRKLYPDLITEVPETENEFCHLETWEDGYDYLAEKLRMSLSGLLQEEEKQSVAHVVKVFEQQDFKKERMLKLMEAALFHYENKYLSKELALKLYGNNLLASVTRLENFASCAYKHFLAYGLSLKEREEYDFEALDMGNIFHDVLAEFSRRLAQCQYTWFDFPEEFGEKLLYEIVESVSAGYGNSVLYDSARSTYVVTRIKRILRRTIFTLQNQICCGEFEPKEFELSFQSLGDIEAVDIALSQEEKLKLVGRIDRIDTYTENNKCYIKVIDYKSGNQNFDIVAVYHGLQLQLLTYLNAAKQFQKKKQPDMEVIPAGILYYHVDDPMIDGNDETTTEQLNELIRKELRVTGVVNKEQQIVEKMDHSNEEYLQALPIRRKKDGSFYKTDMLMSREDMDVLSSFVNQKIRTLAADILKGNIEAKPYDRKRETGCDYCIYKKVCGFDKEIPGYETKKIESCEQEVLLEKMREELKEM